MAGPGLTVSAHALYRGCTAAPSRRAPRSQLCSLIAQPRSSAPARQWISTFLLVYLVYKAGTGCIGSCCSMQRQKPACARPLTPSWWMKRAPASEHRRATSKHRLRPLPGYPLEVAMVGEAATADVYGASSTHATSESCAGRCLYAITKAKLICASWRSVH